MRKQNFKKLVSVALCFAMVFSCNNNLFATGINITDNGTFLNKKQSDVKSDTEVKAVEELIDSIGTVEYTDECLAKIEKAENAYEKLNSEQKLLVSNYGTLKAARTAYEALAADNVNTSDLTVIDSGNIGNLKWAVYTNGLLEVEGDGAIPSYSTATAPWSNYVSSINAILVRSSVTAIGEGAFNGCDNVTKVTLPFVGKSRTATDLEGTFGYIFGYEKELITNDSSTGTHTTTLYSSNISDSKYSQKYTIGNDASYKSTKYVNGVSSLSYTKYWENPWYTCCDGSYNNAYNNAYHGQIQTYIFKVPEKLTTVTITDADKIETAAFNNCKNITKIVLNDGITSIGDYAFQNSVIKDFVIPNTVITLGENSFYGCVGLTEIMLPNGITEVPKYAFYGCDRISKVTLSRSTKAIGNYAFKDCSRFTKLVIPDKCESIGMGAFENCSSITAINIPDSVTWISTYCFSGCSSAKELSIGKKIEKLNNYVFQNCTGLTSIIVPKTVTDIQEFAFYGCDNVTEVTLPFVGKSRTATGLEGTFGYIFGYEKELITNDSSTGTHTTTLYSSNISDSKYSQKYTIGNDASYKSTKYVNGVSSLSYTKYWENPWYTCCDGSYNNAYNNAYHGQIQTYIFKVPEKLTTVTITDADKIETAAFNNCKNITKIVLNDGITSIGDYAFQNNPWYDGLTDEYAVDGDGVLIKYNGTKSGVVIPDTVKHIAGGVFKNKTIISSIALPDKLLSIGENAFDGCTNLSEMTIPRSVVEIGGNAIPATCTIKVYQPSAGYDYRSTNRIVLNESFTTGNAIYQYIINDDGYAEITGCKTTSTELTVPTNINGTIINKIGDYCFAKCSTIKNITIPTNITNIGKHAFEECYGLVNATIPTTVDEVGDYAFKNCTGLKNVTISEGVQTIGKGVFYNCTSLAEAVVPDTASHVGAYAFYNCSSMTTATIGTIAESIGDYTFYNCKKLENIVIGYNVKTIGDYAFYGCALGRVSIPSVTTSIGEYAFADNLKMTKATLRKNLLSIGDGAFKNCGLLATVSIPTTVTYIGSEAFENCTSISSLIIPTGVTEINNRSFSNCSSLTSIALNGDVTKIGAWAFYNDAFDNFIIPETVTVIGNSAFRKCTNLTSITIPSGVTKIGNAVFFNCSALNNVSMSDSVDDVGDSVFFYNDDLTIYIRNNSGFISNNMLEMQGMKHVILDSDINAIGDNAFASCYALETISYDKESATAGEYKFSNKLKTFGKEVFKDNPKLRNLIVPDTLEKIGTNAFYNTVNSGYHCKDVTVTFYYVNGVINANILNSQYVSHVVIDGGVHTLSDKAFYNCSVLESISIPDTVVNVGINVFANPGKKITATFRGVDGVIDASVYDSKTTGIEYIAIDENVNTIGDNAFANSNTVSGVVITDIDTIGESAFQNGKEMEYIEVGKANKIGKHAFSDTTTNRVELDDINVIDDYAFSNCTNLNKLYIDSVININNYAFSNCIHIGKAYINSAKSINDYAFYNDAGMYDIVIEKNLMHIGEHAFDSCKAIQKLVLPDTVSEIGAYAFYDCNSMKTINIPDGVENINDYTFFGCASLNKIDIPNTVVGIGAYAFYGCVVAKQLMISENAKNIGEYAFYNCNQVKEIKLPNKLESIGNYAFRSCSGIKEINVPNSVTKLGDCVFYACTGLEQAEFGNGITKIGNSEFYGCVKFEKIMLNGKVDYIHDLAFYGAEDAVIYSFKNQYVKDYCDDMGLEYHELANDFTMTITAPVKTEYIEFEELDLTGLTLNIIYAIGGERTVTSGYTISGYNPEKIGNQTVSVTYKGVTETFDVTVTEKEVSFITVKNNNNTNVIIGEELDMSNVDIIVNYKDGTKRNIKEGYEVQNYDNEKLGEQTVTIKYRGKIGTFNVTVIDYVRGDINGDGIVSIKDVTRLVNYLNDNSGYKVIKKALDVNGDGVVSIKDVTRLEAYLNDNTVQIY